MVTSWDEIRVFWNEMSTAKRRVFKGIFYLLPKSKKRNRPAKPIADVLPLGGGLKQRGKIRNLKLTTTRLSHQSPHVPHPLLVFDIYVFKFLFNVFR
jgi:hypothetical protein